MILTGFLQASLQTKTTRHTLGAVASNQGAFLA